MIVDTRVEHWNKRTCEVFSFILSASDRIATCRIYCSAEDEDCTNLCSTNTFTESRKFYREEILSNGFTTLTLA